MSFLSLAPNVTLLTQKAKGLRDLAQKDVRIPITLILEGSNWADEIPTLLSTVNADYFYCRISFSDTSQPHHLSETLGRSNLLDGLKLMTNQAEQLGRDTYDFIVQPILNFDFSGVAMVHDQFMLVEVVFGHIISLLRHGEFRYRFLYDLKGNLLDVAEGTQSKFLSWENGQLECSSQLAGPIPFHKILRATESIRTTEKVLYEFGVQGKEVTYLEEKPFNLNGFKVGFAKGRLEKPFIVNEPVGNEKEIYLIKPTMNDIGLLFEKEQISFTVQSGALLSHFSTYCLQHNMGCRFL